MPLILSRLLWPFVLGVIYFVVTALTVTLTRFDGGVSFIWVANALLLAELMNAPRRRWPLSIACCAVGVFAATSGFGLGLKAAPFMMPINVAEAIAGALLLERLRVRSHEMGSLRRVGLFVGICGAAVPGTLAFASAAVANWATGTGYWANWAHWTVGHGLGTVIFTPICSLAVGGELRKAIGRSTRRALLAAAALMALMLAISVAVFAQNSLPLLFLPMLPMMLAAFCLGFPGAAASTAILTIVSVVFTMRGSGPIHLIQGRTGLQVDFLQFYLATTVIMALPVAATLQARKALYRRLQESEARYRLIAERSGDVILNIGATGEMRYVSPSMAQMFGHDPAALIGKLAGGYVAKADLGEALRVHADALARPEDTHVAEYRILAADGRERWCEAQMRAVLDETGQVTGVVNSLRDISHRKAIESELLTEARTDALTGVANRRAFSEALHRSIAAAAQGGPPACCALFDLDYFKAVNDRYGHETGDMVLKAFAAAAGEAVRQEDLVARIGGEEFAVLLRGVGMEEATQVCERLREHVARLVIGAPGGASIGVTVSVGIAPVLPATDDAAILRAADAALYRAKSAGRNRLMLAA